MNPGFRNPIFRAVDVVRVIVLSSVVVVFGVRVLVSRIVRFASAARKIYGKIAAVRDKKQLKTYRGVEKG